MMERIVYLDRSVLRTAVRRPAFEHEWIEYAANTNAPSIMIGEFASRLLVAG
jgi:hypothetical protein